MNMFVVLPERNLTHYLNDYCKQWFADLYTYKRHDIELLMHFCKFSIFVLMFVL